jgi:hypothetical protein
MLSKELARSKCCNSSAIPEPATKNRNNWCNDSVSMAGLNESQPLSVRYGLILITSNPHSNPYSERQEGWQNCLMSDLVSQVTDMWLSNLANLGCVTYVRE